LSSAIADVTGYVLEPVPDGAAVSEKVILIGMTGLTPAYPNIADDKSYIGVSGTVIQLGGNSAAALLNAVGELTAMFEPKSKNISLELTGDNFYPFDNSSLTAMSFNILYKMDDKARIERVYQIIKNYLPDTFGVQEATPQWMKLLSKEFGELYDFVGEGRDGGDSGEYSAVFYNKTKFELLDSGTKWLSDTPDRVSKVPESSLNRVFTYALLKRQADGLEIMAVNTHFDHTSDTARERQAEVLRDFLLEYTDKYPVILTGDFNTTTSTKAYKTVLAGGVTDAMDISEETLQGATFTSFGSANSVIDFVFVTEDTITVRDYRVCNEKIDGNFPSDHHPVLIEYIPVG
ncbi:MAG: endonuclease/exonuclease/phosphatase family protein, partial [Clostridia bacterium]|nr:endonuclease/exonuclease/phosphatase family protein [Clostridia bacterium]